MPDPYICMTGHVGFHVHKLAACSYATLESLLFLARSVANNGKDNNVYYRPASILMLQVFT